MTSLKARIVLLSMILTAGTVNVFAKRWRSLTPARSTKLDAAALVKECETPEMGCHFEDDNSEVLLIFSGGHLVDGKCPNMPAGTVLAVVVTFKRPQPLKNFRLKNQKEILFDPSILQIMDIRVTTIRKMVLLLALSKDVLLKLCT